MGFREAEAQFVSALREDRVSHDLRTVEERNWVACSLLSLEEERKG